MSTDIDIEVAEKVMEWKRHDLKWDPCSSGGILICKVCNRAYACPPWTGKEIMENQWCGKPLATIPFFSTDMIAAWQVIEKMLEKGFFYFIGFYDDGHFCVFKKGDKHFPEKADTAPMAICKAALLAVGKE